MTAITEEKMINQKVCTKHVLTTRELGEYLRKNQLDITSWERIPLTDEARHLMKLDLDLQLEFRGVIDDKVKYEIFVPTVFGGISGYKFELKSLSSGGMVYGVGVRIFLDTDYRNPNEWIWAPELRDKFSELIQTRVDDDMGKNNDVFIDSETGAATVALFLESEQPDIQTDHLATFLVQYFDSGRFDQDLQCGFYHGWKRYLMHLDKV